MKLKKIFVDTVLFYKNGSRQRKEFEFEKLGQLSENSLVKYIMDNTADCTNVVIIDVKHEFENNQ